MSGVDWAQKPQEVQGGAAWHQWRSKGIGASEAPMVMGVSPWATPYQGWLLKSGKVAPEPAGWAAQRGTRLEPLARAKFEDAFTKDNFPQHYEDNTLTRFPAETFEKDIMRASMDGWCEQYKLAVEIKCPGEKTHQEAKDTKKCPIHYWWQIQHQYYVSDAKCIYYCSFWHAKDEHEDDGEVIWFPVERDDEAIEKLLEKCAEFWNFVETDTAPPLTDKDIVTTRDKVLAGLVSDYDEMAAELSILKQRLDLKKKEILKRVKEKGWQRVRCGKAFVYHSFRKGSVDYAKIPVLQDVDLDQYRKKGTESWTIKLEDK